MLGGRLTRLSIYLIGLSHRDARRSRLLRGYALDCIHIWTFYKAPAGLPICCRHIAGISLDSVKDSFCFAPVFSTVAPFLSAVFIRL